MRKQTIICIIFLLIHWSFPTDIDAQTNNSIKDINIHTGFTFLADWQEYNLYYGVYITPSFRFNKHEFCAGPMIFDYMDFENPKPLYGIVAGYRYYFFKEPMRVNMYLNYLFQYYRWHGSGIINNSKFNWHDTDYHNVIGIGFNVYIDKNRRFSFYSTLGCGTTIERSFEYPGSKQTNYGLFQIDIGFGFCFKLCSLIKKSG